MRLVMLAGLAAVVAVAGCSATAAGGATGQRPVSQGEARAAVSYIEGETYNGPGTGFTQTVLRSVEQVDDYIWCARLDRRYKTFSDVPFSGAWQPGGACWYIGRDPALPDATIEAPRDVDRQRLIFEGRWPSYVR